MPLSSMTGYARASSALDALHWQWEIKSVNGKGLDIRCRLPPGYETLDLPGRAMPQNPQKRGNAQIGLILDHAGAEQQLAVNETILEQILQLAERLRVRLGGSPPPLEAVLALARVTAVPCP